MPRDTSILSGKWGWVWMLSQYQGGIQEIIVLAKYLGLRGILVKSGDIKHPDWKGLWPQFPEAVAACKAAGLEIAAWPYCYGDDPQAEAKSAFDALQAGASFICLDVELEYAGKADAAVTMGQVLRNLAPDALITISPGSFPANPNFENYPWNPQWGEIPYSSFLPWVDAILPQVYWADWPPTCDVGLKTFDKQLKAWGKPVYPIGQTYAGQSYTPQAGDYDLFESTCKAIGYNGVSFYDLANMNDTMKEKVKGMDFPIIQPAQQQSGLDKDAAEWLVQVMHDFWHIAGPDGQKVIEFAAQAIRVKAGLPTPQQ